MCYGLRRLNRSTRARPYQTVVAHPSYRTVFDVVSLLNRFYVWKAIEPLCDVCQYINACSSASATRLSTAPRWERLRDHGHGRRPSPTQTAPRGGRSRDYLVGGGRSASHVPYPDLAGRHRGQAAIGATGVTGAALNSLFYRSRVQPLAVTADASWLHRAPRRHACRSALRARD